MQTKPKTNLRQELEKRQMRVKFARDMENSDPVRLIYDKCEADQKAVEDIIGNSKDMTLYYAGLMNGIKQQAQKVQEFILNEIGRGDVALREMVQLEKRAEDEEAEKSRRNELNETYDRLNELLDKEG